MKYDLLEALYILVTIIFSGTGLGLTVGGFSRKVKSLQIIGIISLVFGLVLFSFGGYLFVLKEFMYASS